MKLLEIINQLKAVIPRYTDDFSTILSVSSLTRSGSTVTATTSTPHGLDNYKGTYATATALNTAYSTANINDFATVTATGTQWIWVADNINAWQDTGANNISLKVLISGAKTPILLSSLTQVNGYASAICATKHNLTLANEEVEISGADQSEYNNIHNLVWTPPKYQIESITIDTGTNIATVTTIEDNGFIANANFDIQISGTAQSAYNRKTTIASIVNSKTFTIAGVYGANEDGEQAFGQFWQVQQILNAYTFVFEVDSAAVSPATGTIYQVYEYQTGYNGYKTILSVPSTTTFTYAITTAPLSPAQGTIKAKISANITGAISLEKAIEFFITQFETNKSTKWLIATVGPRIFSKSNFNNTDAVTVINFGDQIREAYTQETTIYAFLPTGSINDELLYIATVDKANEYFYPILKSLLGLTVSSGLTDTTFSRLAPTSTGQVAFTGGYYIYQFTFQATNYISQGDAVEPADLSAFRSFDFEVLSNTDDETVVMEIAGEVDEAD